MRDAREARSRRKTLRVQADIPHTFGPLLVPFAAILVLWGGIMLERSIARPLETDAASILFNSVILAFGLLLVSYLLRSIHIYTDSQASEERVPEQKQAALRPSRRPAVLAKAPPPPRPFHRYYVDGARISR